MFDLITKAHKNREIAMNGAKDNTIEVDPGIVKEIEFVIQQPSSKLIFF